MSKIAELTKQHKLDKLNKLSKEQQAQRMTEELSDSDGEEKEAKPVTKEEKVK